MKKMVRLLFCSLPLIVLAACGGGGGSSSTASPGTAPVVLSVTPFDGATGVVASATAIKVTFSEAMDPATITVSTTINPGSSPLTGNGTFIVSYVADVTSTTAFGNYTTVTNKTFAVPGTLTADPANKIFTFTPTSSLAAVDPITGFTLQTPRTFKVTIKGGASGVKEAGGTPMTLDKNSSFTIWAGTQQTPSSTLYNDVANGVGTDADGNVYLAGYTYGSLGSGVTGTNLDTGNSADILLSKYDSNGALQWNEQMGSGFNDQLNGFAVDNSSGTPQLVAVGYTDGTLPFSNRTNPDATGATHNYLVAKYIEGNPQPWTVTQAGNAVNSRAFAVATDINGNIYVAGETYGDLPTPGGTTATYQGGGTTSDIFVAKYDKSLNLVWTKVIGSAGNDRATGIVVDTSSNPNIYITGFTSGSLFGVNQGGNDIFVAKLDNTGALFGSGNFQPAQFGTAGDDHANAIAVDSSGFVTVVGGTTGSLFGTNQGGVDIFVVAFDPLGNIRWQHQIGTASDDDALGVTADALGSVYVTGSTSGSLFGTNQGGGDVFVINYDKAGNKIWSSQLGSAQSDVGTAAAVFVGPNGTVANPSGNLYLAGYTYGDLDTNFNQSGGKSSGIYNTSDIFLIKYNTATGLKY